MSDRANIDKIMDISSFTTARGFVVSSSDEEDNATEVNRSSRAVGSRMANLFATAPPKQQNENQNGKKKHLFADSVVLYAPGEHGQMEPKGQVGVVVIESSEQYLLLLYNASKQIIASYPLAEGSVTMSVQYGSNSYLSISSANSSISLLFDETKRSQVVLLVGLIMILCEIERCPLSMGDGDPCTTGSHILVDEKWIRLEDGQLQVKERPGQKFKLTGKSQSYMEEMQGHGKGGCRIVRMAKNAAVVLTVRKIKFPGGSSKTESVVSESETSSQTAAEQQQVHELSDIEAEVAAVTEKTSDIMTRIARVGQPIIPNYPLPKAHCSPNPSPEEMDTLQQEEVQPIETEATPSHPPSNPLPREYSTFHSVVGTEMDRLEIRLEAAVQRMIDRAVEPLQHDIKKLLLNQEKILDELRQLQPNQ